MSSKYNILLISSYPPDRSAGLASDYIKMFHESGHQVDFLTLYDYVGRGDDEYCVLPEPWEYRVKRWKKKFPFLSILKPLRDKYIKAPVDSKNIVSSGDLYIPNLYDELPPVENKYLIKAIPSKKYNFVCVLFMQRMLSTSSLEAIYDYLQVPILISAVDMASVTGGCYYAGACTRYEEECGMCPVLNSSDNNDQTHKNFLYKKEVYGRIKCGILCNSYIKDFVQRSKLFKDNQITTRSIIIDKDKFCQEDPILCRKHFCISPNKQFIILTRFAGMKFNVTKGYDHLLNILHIVSDRLSVEDRKNVLLLTVGEIDESIFSKIGFDALHLGRVGLAELVKAYSASNVFISTSINDAGPSMVNQSMMCGTPVVSFSIGTALDVIEDGISGYRVENYNDDEFADRIYSIYSLNDDEYSSLRSSTRKTALAHNTADAIMKKIQEAYEHILSNA